MDLKSGRKQELDPGPAGGTLWGAMGRSRVSSSVVLGPFPSLVFMFLRRRVVVQERPGQSSTLSAGGMGAKRLAGLPF